MKKYEISNKEALLIDMLSDILRKVTKGGNVTIELMDLARAFTAIEISDGISKYFPYFLYR